MRAALGKFGKRRLQCGLAAGDFPPHAPATLEGVEAQVTIPFPSDLFEALARRVAELLREQPPVQRFMDSDTAAAYLGIAAKTLKTREWRDDNNVPYAYIGGRLLFDRLALDQRFASCTDDRVGTYTVARVSGMLGELQR